MSTDVQLFSFVLFSHRNPVYAPSRPAATARKWVEAAQRAAEWLLTVEQEATRKWVARWAASHLLDCDNLVRLPPGYPAGPYCGPLRRQDKGIEADVLDVLAEFVIRRWRRDDRAEMEEMARLWAVLYPHTAQLLTASVTDILSEWDLSPSESDDDSLFVSRTAQPPAESAESAESEESIESAYW